MLLPDKFQSMNRDNWDKSNHFYQKCLIQQYNFSQEYDKKYENQNIKKIYIKEIFKIIIKKLLLYDWG